MRQRARPHLEGGRRLALRPSPDSFLSRNPPAPRDRRFDTPRYVKHRYPTVDRRALAPVPAEIPVERNLKSLHLYRELIRAVLEFPVERLRPKIRFNVSEAFQLQRMERDAKRLDELQVQADRAIRLLRAMSKLDQPTLESLFSRALNVDGQYHAPPKET